MCCVAAQALFTMSAVLQDYTPKASEVIRVRGQKGDYKPSATSFSSVTTVSCHSVTTVRSHMYVTTVISHFYVPHTSHTVMPFIGVKTVSSNVASESRDILYNCLSLFLSVPQMKHDFPPHQNKGREASFKPMHKYQPSDIRFERYTTAQSEYREWPVTRREKPTWATRSQYAPSSVPFEG